MLKIKKLQFGGVSGLGSFSNPIALNQIKTTARGPSIKLLDVPSLKLPTIPTSLNTLPKPQTPKLSINTGLLKIPSLKLPTISNTIPYVSNPPMTQNVDNTTSQGNNSNNGTNLFSPSWGNDVMKGINPKTVGGGLALSGISALNGLDQQIAPKQASTVNTIGGVASNAVSQLNPLAGAANSVGNILSSSIFGRKADPDDVGGQIINQASNVASMFGPVGMGVGAALKLGVGAFTSKIGGNTMNARTAASTGFTGTLDDNQEDSYRLFGKGKQRRKVAQQQERLNTISGILKDSDNAIEASNNFTSPNRQINYTTGFRFGKHGVKLPKQDEIMQIQIIVSNINEKHNKSKDEDIEKVNIIPDGKLHAHKNNLDKIDEKFSSVTPKGIPVIIEDGDTIKQTAEIEKEEIIFHLEVTKKLEELRNDGSVEAMIEAGKILAKEIMENTIDFTNKIIEDENSKN